MITGRAPAWPPSDLPFPVVRSAEGPGQWRTFPRWRGTVGKDKGIGPKW